MQPTPKLATWALAALLALTLVPFALAEEPAAGDSNEPKDEGAADETKAEVELLAAGAEPRKTLRYTPKKGMQFDVVMTMEIETESVMGSMPFPTIVLHADLEVAATHEGGDFTTKGTFRKIETKGEDPQGMGAMIMGALDAIEGIQVTTRYQADGHVVSKEFSESDFVDPMQKQMFDSMRQALAGSSTPLPKEPVGVGGKWKVTQDIVSGEAEMTLETIHEVVEIEGQTIHVASTIKQSGDEQEVQGAMGIPVTIEKIDGKGKGTGTLDLGKGLSLAAEMAVTIEQTMSMDMGTGEPQTMEQVMRVKSTLEATEKATTPTPGK